MTAGKRYLIGLAIAGTVGLGIVLAVDPGMRREVAWGVGLGLVVQAPLGWWTLRSIGTARFLPAWVGGMLARLALLAIAGLILIPALGWPMGPALGALVGAVLTLLLMEAVIAAQEHSGIKAR